MAKKKPNPLLAAYEAKLEAEFQQRLAINSELELISDLIAANNELKVGKGRAGYFLAEKLDVKMQIATEIVKEDDPELIYTKHNLAKRLKSILGKESWMKYRELFPLLREYWDWEED